MLMDPMPATAKAMTALPDGYHGGCQVVELILGKW